MKISDLSIGDIITPTVFDWAPTDVEFKIISIGDRIFDCEPSKTFTSSLGFITKPKQGGCRLSQNNLDDGKYIFVSTANTTIVNTKSENIPMLDRFELIGAK